VRSIAVVTVGRSDYGIYLPILRHIQSHPDLELRIIAAGMHLSPAFGRTVCRIESDGFEIDERVEMLLSSDTPAGVVMSMGLGLVGFAQAYARRRPDILLVLGDRFEMHTAALAALPFNIPVAHIHGGELTEGAIDDAFRHSMTKLSHLHFVAADEYAARVIQMGEEPWRVVVSGAPALDNLRSAALLDRAELTSRFQLPSEPYLLVTFHPVTLEYEQTEFQVTELFEALRLAAYPVVFTAPNADMRHTVIGGAIRRFVREHDRARLVDNFGTFEYLSAMRFAAAVVGNSSSGLIEAPSLRVPVVNIGTRQQGRIRAKNVIDTGYDRAQIVAAIRRATDPAFRPVVEQAVNPYGNSQAAEIIVDRLARVDLGRSLIVKKFADGTAHALGV
jgi:UDP-N-acetylglucosamine 2-epimerase (non-hydrolysing)/GDP/UDP-N,N'-diacetylbacillosamine 2-epimerase (hydrolysing)